MRTLRVRFIIMLATAAVVPLLTYGVVSVYSLRQGTRRTLTEGSLNVARQVGEQVRRYVSTNLQILQALAANIDSTGLSPDQQDQILTNYVLRFPEFSELTAFDESGRAVATSRIGRPNVAVPGPDAATILGVRMSPVFVDNDLLPTALVAAPVRLRGPGGASRAAGWLVGEFRIEELWQLIDRIKVGSSGYVMVVSPSGELLAHGNPDERSRIARGAVLDADPVVAALQRAAVGTPVVQEVPRGSDGAMLVIGVRIPDLDWMVMVEQPAREAYAVERRQERTLIAAICMALLVMLLAGLISARSIIGPIRILTRGTEAIAEGRLNERVHIGSRSELGRLGDAFNRMAGRLGELQEDVRKQERHAMFGRVAAGLVHDLSHPFQNIQNNCRLVVKMHDDPEYLELFRRTIDREFAQIKRVFEDLRNIARPMPMERFPLDVDKLAVDVAESMRANADAAGLTIGLDLAPGPLVVEGDVFALGRVCRNLVMNAIEATNPRGVITVGTGSSDACVTLRVSDTGCGIAPGRLDTLFEDFHTTKRQGLGLGLAITKKIVDQSGGTITVTSEVGRGTTFVVTLPRSSAPVGGTSS